MVKTRGMHEPVTAATEGDESVSTELATAVGPTDPPNYSVTESDQTQPHSPGATTPPHRQLRGETKTDRKALARARLELAAARLALLEAESADEELLEGSSTATSKRQTDAADTLSEHRDHIRPPQSQPMTPNDAPPQRSDEGSLLQGLTQALLEVARGKPAASRYEFDLPIYSGHPGEWLHFKAAYNESASAHTEAGNLARLRKSLRGAALEAVKCLFLGSSAVQIMQRLESRFGRPNALITYELNKLRQLPKVSDNPTDICVFASKVTNAIAAVQALKRTEYLYSPEMISAISEKLSVTLRSRWYDYEMAAGDAEPGLVVLGRFLDREADLNARHASAEMEHKRDRPQRPAHKTFKIVETDKTPCVICNGNCSSVAICSNFRKMLITDRWETARKNKLCFRCLNRRTWKHRCKSKQCEVQDCEHYHHRLLHSDSRRGTCTANDPEERPRVTATGHVASRDDSAPSGDIALHAVINNTSTPRMYNQVLLKVVPVTLSGPNGKVDTFALLDDGSTITLLTTDVAQQIGAEGPNEPFYIEALAGARIDATNSQRVKVNIRGKHTTKGIDIEARTIDRLELSGQSIRANDLAGFEHLTSIVEQLAYDTGVPTVLIGQDNWALLLASEARVGTKDQPVASRTPLGWILHGKTCSLAKVHVLPQIGERCSHVSTDESIEKLIQEHFSLESLGVQPRRPQADPEVRALKILEETTRALPEGGYETGLLWKNEDRCFPDNYASALIRLQSTESRLRKDQTLKQKYSEQMKALLSNGYAELAPPMPSSKYKWYLPHFPVINPSKQGKVRIVYDAAARTHGVCLNDYLLTGPDLLQSLLGVLLRFRQKPVAVSADIKDMFLRITVRVEDRDALRFLWRDDTTLTPIEYRMKAVLFGATSSPSTAIYVKNHNAHVHEADYPEAVNSIVRNHYMDDFLQSFDNTEEANRVSKAVDAIHRRGNFELQKWASNEAAAVAGLATEPVVKDTVLQEEEKILGLIWRHQNDTLGFNFRKVDPSYLNKQVTKRQLLKTTMSLYDPLGLAAPFTTQAKCILQEAWRFKIGWDERLPKNLERKWHDWLIALHILKGVRIPRCHLGYNDAIKVELHVFVDASERAYAAAAYLRSVNGIGQVNVSLAAAKGRVAPLKVTSIPRLELQAAVLGGRLARCVEEEHDRRADRRVFWSDSRTVLAWLRAGARTFKPFVAHRVAELEETTERSEWRWVPTAHNVADDSTRDSPTHFTASHRWYIGPSFLYDNENAWPQETDSHPYIDTGEERVTIAAAHEQSTLTGALPDVTRFSSWLRLIRTTARVLQFIDRLRVHTTTATCKRNKGVSVDDPNWTVKQREGTRKRSGMQSRNLSVPPTVYIPLGTQYTRRAELLWTRVIQEESFATELSLLTGGRTVLADSRLKRLSLTVDEHKIMRIRSRIAAAAEISQETQSPAVLDGDHRYCRLYIDWIHRKLHHSGVECVVNEIRQRYWILRLRPSVRAVIRLCQPCRLRRAVPPEPLTGDLPPCRLAHHQRPFTHTGLDYFGPLSVTVARHHEKRYVALFTCLTTRAVHLEVAASLSTDAGILALRRMMARRGCPEVIWSDNGTNFHGADAELRKAALESLQHEAEVRHIDWRYIPPRAPFMGGAWERLARTVKAALNATLSDRHPYEDVLHTLLTEVEHTVNSRPLTHVSVNPDDEEALTPNHFLLGAPSKVPLPGIFTRPDELRRSHWRASQRLADLFWQRWVSEVLPTLQNRREPHGRGDTVKVGDLVVIVDPNLPRNIWPKGRVERMYPGADGVVRVVDVKTKSGVMRRPVKRLVVIPVET